MLLQYSFFFNFSHFLNGIFSNVVITSSWNTYQILSPDLILPRRVSRRSLISENLQKIIKDSALYPKTGETTRIISPRYIRTESRHLRKTFDKSFHSLRLMLHTPGSSCNKQYSQINTNTRRSSFAITLIIIFACP